MPSYKFYIDESGNRNPDKAADAGRRGRDWFAIGGILVKTEDDQKIRDLREAFAKKWGVRSPLHMTDMLGNHKNFSWLGRLTDEEHDKFWSDYKGLLAQVPAIGLSCVIDRPGYVARGYLEKHPDRWLLCRSAFDIAIERAAKFAKREGRKLHVIFEEDAGINRLIKGYFSNLKTNGLGFDVATSARYVPFTKEDFATTLGTIEHKPKRHPLLQIADSYLYAMARQPYDQRFHVLRRLRDSQKLINSVLEPAEVGTIGIKHYCFDRKK